MDTCQHLLQVLQSSFALRCCIGFGFSYHTRLAHYHARKLIRICICNTCAKTLYHLGETNQFLQSRSRHIQFRLFCMANHIHHRVAHLTTCFTNFRYCRLANTAQWIVDHARKGLIIMGINRQSEISNGIFNLFTLVETHTTINPVWNTQVTQLILYHTRLSIRAVHHRNVFITNALTVQYLHLLGYCLTLISIGHITTQLQSIPQCQLRIYCLRNLTTIMANQRVRGVHNGLGRTIITLQLK